MADQSVFSKSYMTKLRIAEALNRLCENTPLKKIRIEDIVTESGVSRSNFYHNFEDKYAVITWLGEVCHENGIFRIGRDLTWYEGHLKTTQDMDRFRCLFVSASSGSDYDSPVPHFVRKRQDNLRETVLEYQRLEMTEELEFQICTLPHCEVAMTGYVSQGGAPLQHRDLLPPHDPIHAARALPCARAPGSTRPPTSVLRWICWQQARPIVIDEHNVHFPLEYVLFES